MQKKWEAMGPGQKRARKNRSKKSIALAVTHEVDDWIIDNVGDGGNAKKDEDEEHFPVDAPEND